MNAKNVLGKIMALLSKDEVELTYAKLKDGTIVESPTFDVGEPLEVVSEDGAKTPAPDGEHELALTDESGNENLIKVITKDGIITERMNVELAAADEETKKVEDIPQASGDKDKANEVADQSGQVKEGTLLAEETLVPSEDMPETDGEPLGETEEEPSIEIELGKKMEEMAYRIEEMEKKIAKMEAEAPVDETVVEEEEMEEELPKLDGAPIEEAMKFSSEKNKNNFGKKIQDGQSSFLSKLYR
jgi:hypothetical protein